MKGFDIMPSIWKKDKIPDNNTLEKEIDILNNTDNSKKNENH